MSFSDKTEKALLNSLFGKTSDFGALATVPTLFMACSSVDPGEDGSGLTEPVGNGYARKQTAPADWNTASGSPTQIDNATNLAFPAASGGNWGSMTHIALMDAVTGGNVIVIAVLDTPKTIDDGDTLEFKPGNLKITLD